MELDGSLLLTLRDSFAPVEAKIVCYSVVSPNSLGSWVLPYSQDVYLRGWIVSTSATADVRLNLWDKGTTTTGEFLGFGFAGGTSLNYFGIRALIPAGSTIYYHEGTSTVSRLILILELTL